MSKRFSLLLISTLAVASLFHISSAQRDYVVGDALGWVIPPGASTYSTWAASKTFRVGDTLVFNFFSGAHDVTKVTRENYDSCNAGNPILMLPNGPANITLNETGPQYFICGVPVHCDLGQKLEINVSDDGSSTAPQPSPRPQPTTPPVYSAMPSAPALAPQGGTPSPSPVSGPTRSPVTYIVGDSSGWTISSNGASFYQTWASGKNFMVGDILVFNYVAGIHDVLEVSRSSYQECNASNPILNLTNAPTRVTLRTAGQHYYICSFPSHCNAGQVLAINVSSSSAATPPSSTNPSNPSSPGDSNATPPTPGYSAASLCAAGLSATFLSLIVFFFV